jgi:hypothetical protein
VTDSTGGRVPDHPKADEITENLMVESKRKPISDKASSRRDRDRQMDSIYDKNLQIMKTLNADIIRNTKDKVPSTNNDNLLSKHKALFGSNSEKVSRILDTEANRQSSGRGVVGDLSSNRSGLNFDREYAYGSGAKKELASKDKDHKLQKFVSKLVDSCIPISRKDSNPKTSAELNIRKGSTSVTKPLEKNPTHTGHTAKVSNFQYSPSPQVDLTPPGQFTSHPSSNWRSKGLSSTLKSDSATKTHTDRAQNLRERKYNSEKSEPIKINTISTSQLAPPNPITHKTSESDFGDQVSINAAKLTDRQASTLTDHQSLSSKFGQKKMPVYEKNYKGSDYYENLKLRMNQLFCPTEKLVKGENGIKVDHSDILVKGIEGLGNGYFDRNDIRGAEDGGKKGGGAVGRGEGGPGKLSVSGLGGRHASESDF